MPKSKLLYEILSNPIRIKIIELLFENGSLSFTELKNELKISTGSLYYHLSVLSEFVEQDPKRKYFLNEEGKKLYKFIKEQKKEGFSGEPHFKILTYVSGLPLIYLIIENRFKLLFIPLLISLLSIFIFYISNLEIHILFLFEKNLTILQSFTSFLISYFIIYLLIEFFSIFIYKKRINIIETFINVSIIFIPLILFSLIYLLDILLGYFLHNLFQGWILKALFLLFQIWSVILLLNVIKVTKGLSLEKSSFIVLIIIYINLVSSFILFI
jgi:DNA-binding transcriptional ArsR family regulator